MYITESITNSNNILIILYQISNSVRWKSSLAQNLCCNLKDLGINFQFKLIIAIYYQPILSEFLRILSYLKNKGYSNYNFLLFNLLESIEKGQTMDFNLQEIQEQERSRGRSRGRGSASRQNFQQHPSYQRVSPSNNMSAPANLRTNQPQFFQQNSRGDSFNEPPVRNYPNNRFTGSRQRGNDRSHNFQHGQRFEQQEEFRQNRGFSNRGRGNFQDRSRPNFQQGNQRLSALNNQRPSFNKKNYQGNLHQKEPQKVDPSYASPKIQRKFLDRKVDQRAQPRNFRQEPDQRSNFNPRNQGQNFNTDRRPQRAFNERGRGRGGKIVKPYYKEEFYQYPSKKQNPKQSGKNSKKSAAGDKKSKKDDFINQKEQEDDKIMDEQSEPEQEDDESSENQENDQEDSGSGYSQDEDNQAQKSDQIQSKGDNEESNSNIQMIQARPSPLHQVNDSDDICNQKCKYSEFQDRMKNFHQNNRDNAVLKLDTSRTFSVFEINKKQMKPDFKLTLKRFRRSADRAEDDQKPQAGTEESKQNQNYKRSIKGLVESMNHINVEIIDSDNMRPKDLAFPLPPNESLFEFIHIYDFLWDRMREMVKDITRLSDQQKRTKPIIQISEQIARFFIIAINQGRKQYTSRLQFDEKMNEESLRKIITPLIGIYQNSRARLQMLIQKMKKQKEGQEEELSFEEIEKRMEKQHIYISPYEPQITAYAILISNDLNRQLHKKLFTGFQKLPENPLLNSSEIQIALQVQKAIKYTNHQKYFSILQDSKIDYVMSCMILYHLQGFRVKAASVMFNTLRSQVIDNKVIVSTPQIKSFKEALRLDGQGFDQFIRAIGVEKIDDKFLKKTSSQKLDSYRTPNYQFPQSKLERKIYTEKAAAKRVVHPEEITRGELITHSWKKSNYLKRLIAVFLGKQSSILGSQDTATLPRKAAAIAAREKRQEKERQEKQKELKRRQQLQAMREQMKKKSQRKLFIENITKQLQTIFVSSIGDEHRKKKSVVNIVKIITKNLKQKMKAGFIVIQIAGDNKRIKAAYLNQLFQYSKKMNDFQKQKNSAKNLELIPQSRLLGLNERQNNSSRLQMKINQHGKNPIAPDRIFQKIRRLFMAKLQYEQQRRAFPMTDLSFNLTIFVNEEMSSQQQCIFVKFIAYITENRTNSAELCQFCQNPDMREFHDIFMLEVVENRETTTQQHTQICYRFRVIKINSQSRSLDSQIPKNFDMSKEDGLIVFEIGNQLQNMLQFLNSYKQRFLLKYDDSQMLGVPILNFKLKNAGQSANNGRQLYPLLDLTQVTLNTYTEVFSLSSILRIKFKDFIAKAIHLKKRMPEVTVKNMKSLIIEMRAVTLKSLRNYLGERQSQVEEHFIYYVQFFNMWIEQIIEFNEICFKNPELNTNWRKIIDQITINRNCDCDEKTTDGDQDHEHDHSGYSRNTRQQRNFTISVLSSLRMNIMKECLDRRLNFDKKDLAQVIVAYLNQFDSSRQSKDLTEVMANVKVNLGRIYGNCQKLFSFIFLKLAKYLQLVSVLMPADYIIKIDQSQFLAKVQKGKFHQASFQKLFDRKINLVDAELNKYRARKHRLPGFLLAQADDIMQTNENFCQSDKCKKLKRKLENNLVLERSNQKYEGDLIKKLNLQSHPQLYQSIRKMKKR